MPKWNIHDLLYFKISFLHSELKSSKKTTKSQGGFPWVILAMSLSPHRQHKIYIAATMGYGLGSEDPEELAYYDIIKREIRKNKSIGIQRND